MKQLRWERASLVAVCALLLIPLAIHGYIGTYMRLVGGDDFCYTNLANAHDVWGTASYIYTHQQGRMTSNVLLDLLPLIEPTRTPALTMLLLLISVAAYMPVMLGVLRLMRVRQAGLAALMLSLLLNVVSLHAYAEADKAVGQVFMWRSAMTVYLPPRLCLGLTAGVLIWAAQRWRDRAVVGRIGIVLLLIALSVIGGAASEGYATLLIGVCAALMMMVWLILPADQRGGVIAMLAAVMIGAVAALAVILATPMTFERVGHEPSVAYFVFKAVYRAAMTAYSAFEAAPFSMLALIVLPAAAVRYLQAPDAPTVIDDRARWWIRVLLPLAVFAGMVSAAAPSAYSQHILYPRVQTLMITPMVLGMIVWSAISLPALHIEGDPPPQLRAVASVGRIAALLALVVMVIAVDLTDAPARLERMNYHAHAWDRRDSVIRHVAAAGVMDQRVDKLSSLWSIEVLSHRADDWMNQCVAAYYRVESVVGE